MLNECLVHDLNTEVVIVQEACSESTNRKGPVLNSDFVRWMLDQRKYVWSERVNVV